MSALVTVDLLTLAPAVVPAAGMAAVLIADVVTPHRTRTHFVLGLLTLVIGVGFALRGALRPETQPLRTLCLPSSGDVAGTCLYQAGPLASALQLGALGAAAIVLLLVWPAPTVSARGPAQERLLGGAPVIVSLVLAATAGAVAVAAAQDLGSWLVALELATLPGIALVALRGTRAAGSGALSLLVTSVVSFATVALGAALWVVATGRATLTAEAVGQAVGPDQRAVLSLGALLLVAGLGFKLSLVPFHAWTPQAYAAADEPVALFLAATSKVAALAALVAVVRPLTALGPAVLVATAVLAAVTMTLGNLVALVQDDPVRLLAWSTVAQAGWVILPLAALSPDSAPAAAGYLLAYVIATAVAFTVVTVVSRATTGLRSLDAYAGLLRRQPVLGGALALALLALAGLPPGVVGLVAKIVALRPVVEGGLWLPAAIAVVNAVLGIAVYLRWVAVMFRDAPIGPATDDPASVGTAPTAVPDPYPTTVPVRVALGLGAAALVLTSVLPQTLLGLLT